MKYGKFVVLVLVALALVAGTGLALAQGPKDLVVSISHDFSVGGKTFLAGEYRVSRRDNSAPVLFLRAEGVRESTQLPVINRVSRQRDSRAEPNLVFDRLGDQYVLSEIWIGGEDGYVVTARSAGPAVAKDQP